MSTTDEKTGTIAPLVKTLQVNLSIETAFQLFTEGMHTWWPLRSHSVGEDQAQSCVFECYPGGRIYEVLTDGRQVEWGRVTAWNPPFGVSFTWFPGRKEDTAQMVEVAFQMTGGGTRVELRHSGWELLGERAYKLRHGYDSGWDYVLGNFAQRAAG